MRLGLESQLFGIHEQALNIHVRRAEIIAHNLANVSTPNYQAKDIDFRAALQQTSTTSLKTTSTALNRTHEKHLSFSGSDTDTAPLQHRNTLQQSIDGNTVDSHVEHAAYAENTLRYLANITFMNHRLQTLNVVLSGGR